MFQYVKAIAAVVVAILGALVVALGTGATDFGDIDNVTWLTAAGTVLASGALTWWAENVPGTAGGIIKAVIASLTAAVSSLTVALDDDLLTRAEQLTALSAFIVGLTAVYQLRNVPPPKPSG